MRHAGASGHRLSLFLKAVGFSATEKNNRIWAASGGANYAGRLLKRLIKNPNNSRARDMLAELGADVDKAMKRGKLAPDEILMAAKKFSDLTQFRSRAQDLPMWASSDWGKTFFQFKSFVYGQTRLILHETYGEAKAGARRAKEGEYRDAAKRYGRAARTLLILALVFPLVGEGIKGVRSLITGKKRKAKGAERYLENALAVGAGGIPGELVEAGKYRRGAETLAGPTIGEAGWLVDMAVNPSKKEVLRHVPLAGPLLTDRLYPQRPKRPRSLRFPPEPRRPKRPTRVPRNW
jgi:hypothetical protein